MVPVQGDAAPSLGWLPGCGPPRRVGGRRSRGRRRSGPAYAVRLPGRSCHHRRLRPGRPDRHRRRLCPQCCFSGPATRTFARRESFGTGPAIPRSSYAARRFDRGTNGPVRRRHLPRLVNVVVSRRGSATSAWVELSLRVTSPNVGSLTPRNEGPRRETPGHAEKPLRSQRNHLLGLGPGHASRFNSPCAPNHVAWSSEVAVLDELRRNRGPTRRPGGPAAAADARPSDARFVQPIAPLVGMRLRGSQRLPGASSRALW